MELLYEKARGASECGVISSCPFCSALENPWPVIGASIIFLKGHDAGCRGVVVENPQGGTPHHAFAVKMDYETRANTLRMISSGIDLFLDVLRFGVPAWMPPLSIDDNAWLHGELFRRASKEKGSDERRAARETLIGFIWTCWARRLPLSGEDVFRLVEAHGIASRLKKRFVEQFDFVMELLTSTRGRAPIQKRRIPSMSRGTYLPDRQREFTLRLRGGVGKNDV